MRWNGSWAHPEAPTGSSKDLLLQVLDVHRPPEGDRLRGITSDEPRRRGAWTSGSGVTRGRRRKGKEGVDEPGTR